MRSLYKILVGIYERRRLLGRPRCRREGNIRMDLKDVGLDSSGMDQWLPVVNRVMNQRFP